MSVEVVILHGDQPVVFDAGVSLAVTGDGELEIRGKFDEVVALVARDQWVHAQKVVSRGTESRGYLPGREAPNER